MFGKALIILILCHASSIAQTENPDLKRVKKLLGAGYLEAPAEKDYPYSAIVDGVQIDTSTTLVGDTTGIHIFNEYLLFRSYISTEKHSEVLKLIKSTTVSVEEFELFQQFVLDSIAREKIHFGLENDTEAARYLNYTDRYYDQNDLEWKDFDPSDREQNRYRFTLNWKNKFHYDDPSLVPILADMYVPPAERFYKHRIFDSRKMQYRYFIITDRYEFFKDCNGKKVQFYGYTDVCRDNLNYLIEKNVNVSIDDYQWAKLSSYNFDERAILAQLYSRALPEKPVTGILGSQADAFCFWKQNELQKEINKADLPYHVIVTLPERKDIKYLESYPSLVVSETDYTYQWKITCQEYATFVNAVRDSIKRECLYWSVKEDNYAEKLLSFKSRYSFDEGRFEYVEFDPGDRVRNRTFHSLNYRRNIDSKMFKELPCDQKDRPFFKFYYVDAISRGFEGNYSKTYRSVDPPSSDHYYKYYEAEYREYFDSITGSYRHEYGKDLWLYGVDRMFHDPGVRSYINFQRFNVQEEIDIIPLDPYELEEEGLIQSISYAQAIAFYRWKYPIQKWDGKSSWKSFVLPNEDQFNAIQKGEEIFVPEHELKFPTPCFRYVIHVFPRD